MIKNFGENLKNLRKKMDLTQDDIAKILCVSTQTISRWETNMGYPDIEMLPALANFYGVTVDSLLCVDLNKKNEKILEIINQVNILKTKGERNECIQICKNALKEYPNDYEILINLVFCLYNHGVNEEEKMNNNNEVIEICETILEYCKIDYIRHSAIQYLCYTYPKSNKKDKALEIAKTMPGYYATSNELLVNMLNDDEKKKHIQSNLISLIQLISNSIEELFFLNKNHLEKINILKSLVNIYQGFFNDEDYYFFHCRLHRIFRYIAAVYADNKKYEDTIENIEKAAYHAIEYDKRFDEYIYTSSIFNGFKDSINNSSKNTTNNYSWVLLDKLNDNRYDFVRNDLQFIKIIEQLKQYAKE